MAEKSLPHHKRPAIKPHGFPVNPDYRPIIVSDLELILGVIGMGIYSVIGLHFYAILASRTTGNAVRLLLFPLFIILFLDGGFIACRMLEIFHGAGKTGPSVQNLDFSMMLLWAGIIALYLILNRRALKQRFNLPFTTADSPVTPPVDAPARSQLGYLPELDGLRGVAIIFVMIFHGTTFLPGGFIGVDIFFVLSGFLITTLLVQEFDRSKSISLRKFYVRRVLRLGPALIALLIVFCALSFPVRNVAAGWNNCLESLIALAYMTNWANAFGIHQPVYLGHTWSLSIEEQFYIIWPVLLLALLRLMKTRRHIVLVAAGLALLAWLTRICLYLHGASLNRIYNGLDTRADSIMVGCTLGLILAGGLIPGKAKHLLPRILALLAPLSMACLVGFAIDINWLDRARAGLLIVELLTAVLILDACFNPSGLIGKFLGMKWLVWIGTISYGLYLWHALIYEVIDGFGLDRRTVFLIGTFLTFLTAVISYYTLEKPIRALKWQYAS